MQKTVSLNDNESSVTTGGKVFQIMYVSNENESITVDESATIDFSQVIDQLNRGNSIFIAPKNSCVKSSKVKKQRPSGYINHV